MKIIFIISIIIPLCSCANKLIVSGDFPTPLIQPMPYSVGIHYSPNFNNYIYEENAEDRDKWIIHNGSAQTKQFNNVLTAMFDNVQIIENLPNINLPSNNDLIIVPYIHDFQYTMPRETKIKVYEVWLKYQIKILNSNGEVIADWVLTSYGKTPSAFLQSDEEAMNQAVIMSLRDAGISLSLKFENIPEIRRWLSNNTHTDNPTIGKITNLRSGDKL